MPCLLCNSDGPFRHRYTKQGYAIADCESCGLTQLHPPPSPETLRDYYEGAYFANASSASGYDDYASQETEYVATFREDLRRIAQFVPTGTILDVGCSYGYFMSAAQTAGYDAYGLDVSKTAVDVAKTRFGAKIVQGDLSEVGALGINTFDVIFASHVVEHLLEPRQFIDLVRAHLSDSGIAVIVTPNIASVLARASRRRWVSFKVPEHVAYYTPDTLSRLVTRGGLSPVAVDSAKQYYRLPFIAKRLRELTFPVSRLVPPIENLPPFRGRILRITSGSMRLIARK